MTPEQIVDMVRRTLFVALELGAPFLLLAMVVGLIIGLFQTVTHIQEMTLAFVPKILLVAIALAIFFPWMLKILTHFTQSILIHQWDKVITGTLYVH